LAGSNRGVKVGIFLGLLGIIILSAGFATGWEDSQKRLPAYSALLDRGETALASLTALSDRPGEGIQSRKKQNLFTRKPLPLDTASWTKTKENWRHLIQRVDLTISKAAGEKEWSLNWNPEGIQLMTFVLFMGLVLYVFSRLSGFGKRLLHRIDKDRLPYRYLTVLLIQRSLLLLGITLFVYGYLLVTPLMNGASLFRLLFWLLMIVLLSGMAKRFITYGFLEGNEMQHRQGVIMLRLVSRVRFIGLAYGILDWAINGDRLMLFALRMLLLLIIFRGLLRFWKNIQFDGRDNKTDFPGLPHIAIAVLKGLSYAVVIAGTVLDIVGYNFLAFYWITSWGVSIVIGLWAGLFFKLLMEWRLQMKAALVNTTQTSSGRGQPFRWFILQIAWLVWFFAFVFALILAWGGRQAVIVSVVRSLNHPITIGKITFSVTNFVAAFFILLLTHSLVRFWRFVLREKILSESGLESGLQDSITTITVYAFWAFGILLSLHAFGLGTTSLALAFGALGIGLGFGLQNIFNNFISGIIMLFERPIQVGDDVEINGVWATVKKINVRATVVQTYDNASLIIPNSEFISSQVTNWSFKDKRLRRSIDVGVAYGSDIERVRQTLLEIAQNTKNVFKTPQPDVLFRDFGDSALIFRLRVWTDIDNMLKVDTAIRFDIDRLFKERGIVIAFPQVDVHLHGGNEGSVKSDA